MKFKIHQIYFKPEQRPNLDPAFTPYDNSACPDPDLREFYVFQKEYLESKFVADEHVGYVSWKFEEKTGISGQHFLDFCHARPGYDVYFINPFPVEVCWGNVWVQGERHHPGLLDLGQHLFDSVDQAVALAALPANPKITSFCNFWVGNSNFWNQYMSFCMPFWQLTAGQMSSKERRRLFKKRDKRTGATYFAFFFERLFTTFLTLHPEVRALKYEFSDAEIDNLYPDRYEATLARSIQNCERLYPTEIESQKQDPLLLAALQYYCATNARPTFRRLLYTFSRWCWLVLPLSSWRRLRLFDSLYHRLRRRARTALGIAGN